MFYHASPVAGIERLIPHVSEHSQEAARVFFSTKRENTLPYLSNAVQKYCRETGFLWDGPWANRGPYGFLADGTLRLEGYYPDAIADTYRGVSGYIYRAARLPPDAAASPVYDRTSRLRLGVQACAGRLCGDFEGAARGENPPPAL